MHGSLRKKAIRNLSFDLKSNLSDLELAQECVKHCITIGLREDLDDELLSQHLPHNVKGLDYLLLNPDQIVTAFSYVMRTYYQNNTKAL